jgi:hypothetical protein
LRRDARDRGELLRCVDCHRRDKGRAIQWSKALKRKCLW